MRGGKSKGAGLLATLAVLVAAWFFLAPPQLGGRTSYAVVFGVSMEPHFHGGDLVILRAQRAYGVGDVVAYRSHFLHRNVLHRIVAARDGRFTFKGDNNPFLDPEQPTQRDLIGREWLRVPAVGAWLQDLRAPRNAAAAAGLVVLLLGAGGGAPAARRRRRRPRRDERQRTARPQRSAAASSTGFAVAAGGAAMLAAAVVVALPAFTHPLERSLAWSGLYVQQGRFSYAAPVGRSAAYQTPRLRPGDPVYLKLVRRLPVTFAYRLESAHVTAVAGTASLTAVLHDDGGWSHRLVLARAQPFDGSETSVHGVLDLAKLEATIAAFERETGEHSSLYHVRLAAHVHVHGTAAGRPLLATFSPKLAFDLDPLRLAVSTGAGSTGAPTGFVQSADGAGTRTAPAVLQALGRSVTVDAARRLATLLGSIGLALAALGGTLLLLGRRGHEAAAIRRRYAGWIVDVAPGRRPDAVERRVASMEALARLAERYDRMILHESRDDGDTFLVEDEGTVYTYVVPAWDPQPAVAR